MTDPVIAEAIKLRDKLLECAKEFRHHGVMARTDAGKKMAEFDALICEASAEMMAKLGTEVTRLRLGIQHFDHGRMDRLELRKFPNSWNQPEIEVKMPDPRKL